MDWLSFGSSLVTGLDGGGGGGGSSIPAPSQQATSGDAVGAPVTVGGLNVNQKTDFMPLVLAGVIGLGVIAWIIKR